MTQTPHEQFRHEVEAFLAETKMAIAHFGDEACNDRSFVSDLRETKREFRWSTMEKVRAFMARHRAGHAAAGAGRVAAE